MSAPEPVGVELTEAMAVALCREACMDYDPEAGRGCTDCWTLAKKLAEVATRQAPTVLDREAVARAALEAREGGVHGGGVVRRQGCRARRLAGSAR